MSCCPYQESAILTRGMGDFLRLYKEFGVLHSHPQLFHSKTGLCMKIFAPHIKFYKGVTKNRVTRLRKSCIMKPPNQKGDEHEMEQYAWIIWVAAMVVFGIAEAATVNLVSVWFVAGSLAALIVQLLGGSPLLQIAAFLVVSAVLLALLRPFARKFVSPKRTATNADRVLGQEAYVTEAVDNLRETGAVKLDGKVWTARAMNGENLPVGTLIRVVKLEGVKLYVVPVHATAGV